ncbi:MAG: AAA family ATPase, partial [Kiritimatiellae bacterium]|nr:AAA family ATPase [Kiritimatiellia bacterium]
MKIKEIHVRNYCSFGNEAWISFSSNIMALIGRNGVGKTNALDAISRMRFFCDNVESAIPERAVNQNTQEPPELKIHATLDDQDVEDIGPGIVGEVTDLDVTYMLKYDADSRRTQFSFAGLFFHVMQNMAELTDLRKDIKELGDLLSEKRISSDERYQRLIFALKEYGRIYIPNISGLVSWALQNLNHNIEEPFKSKLKPLLESFRDALEKRYAAFRKISPQIHLFRDAAEFPNSYNIDHVRAGNDHISSGDKIALERFLGAVKSSREELLKAFDEKNESVRNNIQDRITKETRKLVKEFNNSYLRGAAEIELNVKFDGRFLRFTICNADTPGSVLWTEASSGVRWYLSAFFELKRAMHSRNSIILIDEPGIHLHVTAQKEALALLQQLAQGTKYVLYTTHSPYLIDKNRLGDVLAVVREENVSVVRNLTSIENVSSRMEALTPVCHALGYDMSMSLTPQASR